MAPWRQLVVRAREAEQKVLPHPMTHMPPRHLSLSHAFLKPKRWTSQHHKESQVGASCHFCPVLSDSLMISGGISVHKLQWDGASFAMLASEDVFGFLTKLLRSILAKNSFEEFSQCGHLYFSANNQRERAGMWWSKKRVWEAHVMYWQKHN